MPKIDITPDIGLRIKELRLKNQIKAKDLAAFLEKSPAYISKLENGEIKQIEHTVFKTMINFLSHDDNGYENFMTKASENISSTELEDSLLFYNFDWIERQIPVTEELVEYIENKMQELKIAPSALINYINENEDLDEHFFEENSIIKSECKENVWLKNRAEAGFYIILNYSVEQLTDLLSKKTDTSNYTFIFALVYHLLKYENYILKNKHPIDQIRKETTNIINSYKFYSITDRRGFYEKSKSKEEFDELLSKFDKENMDLVNQLVFFLQFISDKDVKYANKKLSIIIENLKPNPGFALGYMALPLKELVNVNQEVKMEFIKDVRKLIEIYKNKTDVTIEKY